MKLYEISQVFNEFIELCEDPDMNLDDMEKALQVIEGDFAEKLENCGKLLKNNEAVEKAMAEEIQRLRARKTTLENKDKWLRQYMLQQMELLAKDKVQTGLFKFSIAATPPSVAIINEQAIPPDYYVEVKPELSKSMILADLKAGIEVPGAVLQRGKRLNMR